MSDPTNRAAAPSTAASAELLALPAPPPDDTKAPRRFRVTVREPKATLSLGRAAAGSNGFDGASLQSGVHLLLDAAKCVNLQAGGATTLFFAKDAFVYAGSWAQVTKGEHLVVSKKRALLVAGAGYADEAPYHAGEAPEPRGFNAVDLEALVDGWSRGAGAWEAKFFTASSKALDALGVPRASKARRSDGYLERFVSRGESNPVTKLLGKAEGLLSRAERLAARPELLPVAGPLLERVKSARKLTSDLTKSVESPLELRTVGAPYGSAVVDEAARVKKAAQGLYGGDKPAPKPAEPSAAGAYEHAKASLGQGDAAVKFAVEDAPKAMLRPTRRLLAQVRETTAAIKGTVETAAGALGVKAPSQAAVGVFGKQGVTLATGEKLVGVAQGGFYFVSAPAEKAGASLLSQLKDAVVARDAGALGAAVKSSASGALSDGLAALGLGGVDVPQVAAKPGFVARVAGPVELAGEGDALLAAVGASSVARLASAHVAEVLAGDACALGARKGTAEVLGRHVVLGLPPRADAAPDDRAKEALAASVRAKEALVAAELAKTTADTTLATARSRLLAARVAMAGVTASALGSPAAQAASAHARREATVAPAALATAGVGGVALVSYALDAAYEAFVDARKAVDKAEDELERCRAAVAVADANALQAGTRSAAAVLAGSGAKEQEPAQSVHAFAKKTIALESEQALRLYAAERVEVGGAPPGVLAPAKRVELRGEELHVEGTKTLKVVVGAYTLTLDAGGARVEHARGAAIKLTAAEASVTIGANSVRVDDAGVSLSGPTVKITGSLSVSLN